MNRKFKLTSRHRSSAKPTQGRRLIVAGGGGPRARAGGLLARLIPLAVLAVGALWLMSVMQNAAAQNPNSRYPQQYQNQYPTTGQRFQPIQPNYQPAGVAPGPAFRTAAAPAIPSAAQLTPVDNPDLTGAENTDDAAAFYADWEIPSFVNRIAQGGWLMIPLVICSFIVFALSLERMIALRRSRVIPRPFVRRFTECVEDGQLSYEEATDICKEFDCPVSEVFRAALRRWGRPILEIEQAVVDAGDRVADRLRRFLRVFHAISNVAPLIGLLGTVIGMIEAFDMISSQDSIGRPEVLAGGISTALMTTAGGLCVAIPAYLAYMYFSSKSDRYLGEIDKLCQRVVDSISAEGLEENGTRKKRRAA